MQCAAIPAPAPGCRRRRRRPLKRRRLDYIMTMARFTIYVVLLGVKVVNSCRQSCVIRCNPSAGAGDLRGTPGPGPGLHNDYGQIHNLCSALGVKVVNSCRRRRRRRRGDIMTMARFTIYVVLLGVNVVNSCRQSCAMRCNRAGAGVTS